ncbi:MAG: hypothetical protein ACT4QC_14240, partial [Planctomycetaceae bacterium]
MSFDASDLLALARAGALNERGLLLEKHRAYLELLARVELGRRFQTKFDPSDIVQETFLEAHRKFEYFHGASTTEFLAWLRAILGTRIATVFRHYVATQGRDTRREQPLSLEIGESFCVFDQAFCDSSSTPSQKLIRQERAVVLANALAQLPSAYRDVLILRHLVRISCPSLSLRRANRVVPVAVEFVAFDFHGSKFVIGDF